MSKDKKAPPPAPTPIVVSHETLLRLVEKGGRIEAPKGPTKAA
jgi:hypothetical protein